eukprot:CAMPEP_0113675474 /NCGR_PEP_ID=MMETSP0038_2-20120614/8036_1 /TAXON_ID=2898 /ORGANISM="Cryptomonas paramecium" /LENGTH=78 /DNA_ID=CAMNT_0000592253 /DNA_START=23 /DNA_END=259 /DNA_ORIENTATION=- /assembly_acc=CAM_ASM_000170
MSSKKRALQVGIDVGYKMGDGFGAFWKHFAYSEPIAVLSLVLSGVGIGVAYAGPKIWKQDRSKDPYLGVHPSRRLAGN